MADMFEAYLGVLVIERGDEAAKDWLLKVYSAEVTPGLEDQLRQCEAETEASERKRAERSRSRAANGSRAGMSPESRKVA